MPFIKQNRKSNYLLIKFINNLKNLSILRAPDVIILELIINDITNKRLYFIA